MENILPVRAYGGRKNIACFGHICDQFVKIILRKKRMINQTDDEKMFYPAVFDFFNDFIDFSIIFCSS